MNTIVLHGAMAKKWGSSFEMDVSSMREAFYALCSQLEGFEAKVRKSAFRLVRRKGDDVTWLTEDLLDLTGDNCTLEIYPAMKGGKGGLGKIIAGVAIIGLAIALAPMTGGTSLMAAMSSGIGFLGITYGTVALFGAMIAFGGLAMMFAPAPKAQKAGEASKDDSSFILSGPVNTPLQGGVVPLLYGTYMAGSVTVSSEIAIDQMLAGKTTRRSGAGSDQVAGTYDAAQAWTDAGYPDYPQATSGVGGTGTLGKRSLRDGLLPGAL